MIKKNIKVIKFPEMEEVQSIDKRIYLITFLVIYVLLYCKVLSKVIKNIGFLNENNIYFWNAIVDIVLLLITIIVFKKVLKRDFKYYLKNFKVYFNYSILLYLNFIPINIMCGIIIGLVGEPINNVMVYNSSLVFQIIFGILIGPIIEECLFRGCLRKIIKNKILFIVISSVAFGTAHVIGLAKSPIEYLHIITYMASGIMFSYHYCKTENLASTIGLHRFSNCISLILGIIARLG